MSKELERVIITTALHDQHFFSTLATHIENKFFEYPEYGLIFDVTKQFQEKYSAMPDKEALRVLLDKTKGVAEDVYNKACSEAANSFSDSETKAAKERNKDWLTAEAEKHFKNRYCVLTIMDSIDILDGTNKKITPDAIPDLLAKAVALSFRDDESYEYLDSWEQRWNEMHDLTKRIPFKLSMLNWITNGGVPKKSLVVPLAGTGVGKSIFLCDDAAFLIRNGYNVYYCSLELAKNKIGERIDANLFDVNVHDLNTIDKGTYKNKIEKVRSVTHGKLYIDEYAPSSITVKHIAHQLRQLKKKKNFVPDVVMVDYLGILGSYRMKSGDTNSYTYLKSVAEELRALSFEFDVVVIAPMQTNRGGQTSSDLDLTDVSDSHGISMTADMMFGMIQTEDLLKVGHIRVRQLKNRFGDLNLPGSFVIAADKAKMRFSDLDTPKGNHQSSVTPPAVSKPIPEVNSGRKVPSATKKTSGFKF